MKKIALATFAGILAMGAAANASDGEQKNVIGVPSIEAAPVVVAGDKTLDATVTHSIQAGDSVQQSNEGGPFYTPSNDR